MSNSLLLFKTCPEKPHQVISLYFYFVIPNVENKKRKANASNVKLHPDRFLYLRRLVF